MVLCPSNRHPLEAIPLVEMLRKPWGLLVEAVLLRSRMYWHGTCLRCGKICPGLVVLKEREAGVHGMILPAPPQVYLLLI
jgi:hypothetical protein